MPGQAISACPNYIDFVRLLVHPARATNEIIQNVLIMLKTSGICVPLPFGEQRQHSTYRMNHDPYDNPAVPQALGDSKFLYDAP